MNPKSESPAPFRLRDRLVTPQRNSITGPEGETGVEPKIMAVLCVLASEPGRVFTRSELIDQVWGTEYGADESLTRAISHLRKALGDTRSEPMVIETISKRGYRLLPSASQAQPDTDLASPPRSRRALIVAAGITAIAGVAAGLLLERIYPSRDAETPSSGIAVIVLPFNPVRREPPDTSLATALTVDLVAALARDKRLHVTVKRPDSARPPSASPRYSIYADIQTESGQAKAMVEIMNFDTSQALWSRRYDQAYDGSIAAQDRLSALIARDLTPALLAMPRSKKPG
jgi:DNA-binding winged helix-turn-helix (wHTH) protein/TolB-like protein